MQRAQQHPLIDLAETVPPDASPALKSRRQLMKRMGLAAFAASSTAEAFAQAMDRLFARGAADPISGT